MYNPDHPCRLTIWNNPSRLPRQKKRTANFKNNSIKICSKTQAGLRSSKRNHNFQAHPMKWQTTLARYRATVFWSPLGTKTVVSTRRPISKCCNMQKITFVSRFRFNFWTGADIPLCFAFFVACDGTKTFLPWWTQKKHWYLDGFQKSKIGTCKKPCK